MEHLHVLSSQATHNIHSTFHKSPAYEGINTPHECHQFMQIKFFCKIQHLLKTMIKLLLVVCALFLLSFPPTISGTGDSPDDKFRIVAQLEDLEVERGAKCGDGGGSHGNDDDDDDDYDDDDNNDDYDDDDDNDDGDDDDYEFDVAEWQLLSHGWGVERGSRVLVNVDGFGAVGDGSSDDTQAFVNAWKQACSTPKSVLLVPQGRRYLVNATRFRGPCADKFIIQIDGAIVAPDEPKTWDPKNPRNWLVFSNLTKVHFQGKGVIDGSGHKWWAASCKKNKSNPCKAAPTALTIDSSSNLRVRGITIQNGQQMNFVVSRSESMRLINVKVSAPEDSPNTDGIHISDSTNVVLQSCKIGTGDDCVSIVNGSNGIKMKNIYCGPGHGISIGSLGKDNSTGIVEKVVLEKAFLKGTTNGLRIKTWQGGAGHVRSVRYQDVRMDDVSNPIIIDQFYCDSLTSCQNQTSAVEISQIMYRNITGTSRSEKAMKFACSDSVPCTHIVLNNINLQSSDGSVETYCHSVAGFGYGYIQPSAECLSSSDKLEHDHKEATRVGQTTSEQHPIHTEL